MHCGGANTVSGSYSGVGVYNYTLYNCFQFQVEVPSVFASSVAVSVAIRNQVLNIQRHVGGSIDCYEQRWTMDRYKRVVRFLQHLIRPFVCQCLSECVAQKPRQLSTGYRLKTNCCYLHRNFKWRYNSCQ